MRLLLLAALASAPFLASGCSKSSTEPDATVQDSTKGVHDAATDAAKPADEKQHESGSGSGDGTGVGGGKGGGEHHK
jgi:hypothetical protein